MTNEIVLFCFLGFFLLLFILFIILHHGYTPILRTNSYVMYVWKHLLAFEAPALSHIDLYSHCTLCIFEWTCVRVYVDATAIKCGSSKFLMSLSCSHICRNASTNATTVVVVVFLMQHKTFCTFYFLSYSLIILDAGDVMEQSGTSRERGGGGEYMRWN